MFSVVLGRDAEDNDRDVLGPETVTDVEGTLNNVAVYTLVLDTELETVVDRSPVFKLVLGTEMGFPVDKLVEDNVTGIDMHGSDSELWVPTVDSEKLVIGQKTDADTLKLEIIMPVFEDVES